MILTDFASESPQCLPLSQLCCRALYVGVDIRLFKDIIINSIRSVVGGWGQVLPGFSISYPVKEKILILIICRKQIKPKLLILILE